MGTLAGGGPQWFGQLEPGDLSSQIGDISKVEFVVTLFKPGFLGRTGMERRIEIRLFRWW